MPCQVGCTGIADTDTNIVTSLLYAGAMLCSQFCSRPGAVTYHSFLCLCLHLQVQLGEAMVVGHQEAGFVGAVWDNKIV